MTDKRAFIIILAIGFAVFFNSFQNSFVWDDEEQIVNNVVIQDIRNLPVIFAGGAFNSGGTGNLLGIYYKPLMTLTFALLCLFFGLNSFYYHLTAVIFYCLNAVLVYFLLSKFFDKYKSLLLSLFFLVHPLYSEVAFYLANMQDVLYFMFGMVGLLIVIYKKIDLKWGILLSSFLLLALLSKETGIIFVILSAIYSFIFERSKLTKIIVSGTISVALYSFMRFGLAGIYFSTYEIAPIASLSLFQRIQNIPTMLGYYFGNFLWPANLSINQHWVVSGVEYSKMIVPVALIILLVRKNRESIFFLLFLIISILPHLQLFPLDVTATGRWFYPASVGLMGLFGVLLNKKYINMMIIPIFLLSLITFDRSYDFRNGFALYSNDIKYDLKNFNLENNLGVEYYRLGYKDKAGLHFKRSVDLNPNWWTNYNNLGVYEESLGNLDTAEALYKKAIENGQYYLAYENYARVLINQGKVEEARSFIDETLRILPYNNSLIEYRKIIN